MLGQHFIQPDVRLFNFISLLSTVPNKIELNSTILIFLKLIDILKICKDMINTKIRSMPIKREIEFDHK